MIQLAATDSAASSGAAFFDVDETLIAMKSMQSFLDFYFEDQSRGLPTPWQRFQRTAAGLPREEGNRAYYRLWSGQKFSDLTKAGRTWFTQHIQRPGFLVPAALDAVREHRRAGRQVFLVSGSFHPCLDPLASYLDASEVFCTELVEEEGVLTGEIVRSRIGEGKRLVVEEAAARYGLRPDQTWAYGDHMSDLPMLTAVGHAVAVGSDPQLIRIAHEKRWPTIAVDGRTDTERTEVSNTNTYGDQLIETLLNAASQLHDETGVPMPVIADAMHLGCGIPHSIFGVDDPETDARPEQHEPDVPPIRTLGLIGAGTMSQGIARAALHAGIDVRIAARDPARAAAAGDAVLRDASGATGHVSSSSHLETLAGADIIVEAISEDLAGKQRVLSEVERAVPEDTVLATTTSSLAINDVASALADPRRLVGLHFFNPADRNRLVEFVAGPAPHSHQGRARQLAAQLDKRLVAVPDTPGFIVNRVLIPYLNAVFELADRGVPLREIDLDIRRRYRLPVGPARLAGIIGSDVVLAIQTSLHQRLERPDLRPARALQVLVNRGVLGNKSGHMFPTALNDGA